MILSILKNKLVYSCIAELFISGLFYGFPSLYYALKEENVFSHMDSVDREIHLSSINTISSIIRLICLIPQGIFLELTSQNFSMFIHSLIIFVGCFIMGFAHNNIYLYILSMSLLGIGGNGFRNTLIINTPSERKELFTALISGFNDASSIMFYVFYLISKYLMTKIEYVVLVFSLLPLMITIFFLVLFIRDKSVFRDKIQLDVSILKQSFNGEYLMLCVLFIPVIFYLNFYYSTFAYKKTHATDLNKLVTIFTIINPISMILSSLVIGKLFNEFKDRLYLFYVTTFIITFIWSLLLVIDLSNVPYIQYTQLITNYIFFSLYRASVFSTINIHLVNISNGKYFGILFGISVLFPSILSFIINPIISYSLLNSFTIINYSQIVIFSIVFIIMILYVKK